MSPSKTPKTSSYDFSAYKDFKHYYLYSILLKHRDKFGKLPCYQRDKVHFTPSLSGSKSKNKREVMAIKITPSNTDDRRVLKGLLKGLQGKCYAHKGYISQELFKSLWQEGMHLITGIRKNMKNYLIPMYDKWLLRKRSIIETVLGILKTDINLEHTGHRSASNAFVHILSTIAAYCFRSNKPSFKLFSLLP